MRIYVCGAVLAILGLSIVAPLFAQAPAPRDAQPGQNRPLLGDREGRRERLRGLGGQLLDSVIKPQGGSNAPAIDFNKINAALPDLFGPLINGDLYIDSIQVRFDPQRTNLAQDTFRLSIDLGLRKSAWSTSPSHLHVDVGAVADTLNPLAPRATIEAQVRIDTDLVALADQRLQKYKAQNPTNATATSIPAPQSENEFFQARFAEKLARTDRLSSFDELVDLFQYINSMRFLAQNENIDRLKNALVATTDPAARDKFAAELVKARKARDGLAKTRLDIQRDPSGNAQAIVVGTSSADPSADPAIERAEATVTAQSITAGATVRIQKGMEFYVFAKPLVIGALDRLQQRDPAVLETQRGLIRGFFDRFRRAIAEGEF